MTKIIKSEQSEFNELLKIGFELNTPQDGFSSQPDSGSNIGGLVGEQECGIKADYDAVGVQGQRHSDLKTMKKVSLLIPGESDFSIRQQLPQDEQPDDLVSADWFEG